MVSHTHICAQPLDYQQNIATYVLFSLLHWKCLETIFPCSPHEVSSGYDQLTVKTCYLEVNFVVPMMSKLVPHVTPHKAAPFL